MLATTETTGSLSVGAAGVDCPPRRQLSPMPDMQQAVRLVGLQWPQHPKAICSGLISFLLASCTGCWKCLKVQVQKGE